MSHIKDRLDPFRNALMELQGDRTIVQFAKDLSISRQTLGFYLNGDRIPDAQMLRHICKRCNVSADYLLGLGGSKTINPEKSAALKYTGLSEKALDTIHIYATQDYHFGEGNTRRMIPCKISLRALDMLLTNEGFEDFLTHIDTFAGSYQTHLWAQGELDKDDPKHDRHFLSIVASDSGFDNPMLEFMLYKSVGKMILQIKERLLIERKEKNGIHQKD